MQRTGVATAMLTTISTATGVTDTAEMIATETGIAMETASATETGTATAAAAAAAATATAGMETEGGTGTTGRVRGMGETETIALPSQSRQSVERAGGTTRKSTRREMFAPNGPVPVAERRRRLTEQDCEMRASLLSGWLSASVRTVCQTDQRRQMYKPPRTVSPRLFGRAIQPKANFVERIDTLVFANLSLYLYVCPVCVCAFSFAYSAELTFRSISVHQALCDNCQN